MTVSFEERIELLKKTKGVDEVIIHEDVMYDSGIGSLRPDYVIHGDNRLTGSMRAILSNVKKYLSAYGGKIIDVPYTFSEKTKRVNFKIREKLAMPEFRRKRLAQLNQKISDASREASESVTQVTVGVDQISGVVQTNSATAEQSAAASEELSGQASVLKGLVSEFDLLDERN